MGILHAPHDPVSRRRRTSREFDPRLAAAAIAFALPFALIADPAPLLAVAGLALAACLVLFHEPMDFAYAGYMAALEC